MLILMMMFAWLYFFMPNFSRYLLSSSVSQHPGRLAIDNHPHRKVIVSARCSLEKTVRIRQLLTRQLRELVSINYFGNHMRRILTAGLLCNFIFTPAYASPLYVGFQVDHITSDIFLGFQISKKYAVEVRSSKSESSVTRAGVTIDTSSTSKSIVGIALFPIKLRNVLPCNLFVKAGYERTNKTETYSIPVSLTLSLPYSGRIDSYSNQFILGGGAEYDFTKYLTGRTGLDFRGSDRSFNMAVIYKF